MTRFIAFLIALACLPSAILAQPPQTPAAPSHADILRGEYGRYRANNDLLYYHLDVRVDPEKKYHQRQEHHPLQDAQGRQRASSSICMTP